MKTLVCIAGVVGLLLGVAAQPQNSIPTSVPKDLRERVAAAPNLNKKVDMLATGILVVQDQVSQLRTDTGEAGKQAFNTLSQQEANDLQALKAELADVKNHLIEFRNATCPLLKTAKLKDTEKVQVDKVCQSDSTETN